MNKIFLVLILLVSGPHMASGQKVLKGRILSNGSPVPGAAVWFGSGDQGSFSNPEGLFILKNVPSEAFDLSVSATGYFQRKVSIAAGQTEITIELKPDGHIMDEVVVTGTMKAISRLESPVPVEVLTPAFFKKNPTPSVFEALEMVNGVQPQLNCNVCNTGDIHINGMEGPYTMVLIDGMPIVSGLSTVYGLSGIPNSIIKQVEIVKGPASSLYGSEAMGGIINVITKDPDQAPLLNLDFMGTSWQEYNLDVSLKAGSGKTSTLLGINYFNYKEPFDFNKDGFTDLTLQDRISLFNKWNFKRKNDYLFSLAGRFVYEDRWGGEMNWNKGWRGTDSIYGESIYTKRYEFIGTYQLPLREKIVTQWSYNFHDQNSYYGETPFMARQQVAFGQLFWEKELKQKNQLLLGVTLRYNHYDDNTPATRSAAEAFLPGFFIQNEFSAGRKHKILTGYRFDYDKYHRSIHSPRIAYKWSPNGNNTLRASLGTGFRVVNLFTEDHAALTGAREVVIMNELKPERSYNGNLNYILRTSTGFGFLNWDATFFYSYFTNKITPDYFTDPQKIIYDNLKGYAVSQGISLNVDAHFSFPLKALLGVTYMQVYQMDEREGAYDKSIQVHAPEWSGNFLVSYLFRNGWTADITGTWTGPMRLPVLPDDYRPEYSPWFCIANIQATKELNNRLSFYGGIKNLFNFIPSDPIMRPFDPFDKYADDPVTNPNGYKFDPSYNYASLQGIRFFAGARFLINQ